MKRPLICAAAFGIGMALSSAAVAQTDQSGNARPDKDRPADRAGDNNMRGGDAMQRDNDVDSKVTVKRGPNETVRRSVTTRPNGTVNVRVTRKVFRAPQRFHIARPWIAPRGFVYRRFALGERIPTVLLAADFFLSDYATYGLEYPPPGYVWVRDGGDAVLVDQSTGEVIQVEYDVFY